MSDQITSIFDARGASNRRAFAATATERFIAVASPSPSLLAAYRVRNVGETNAATVRVLRSLTRSEYVASESAEWTEVVAGATVAATEEVSGDVDTVATGIAVGVVSASGTDVIVEILVAK
jgi:hypothetical protein